MNLARESEPIHTFTVKDNKTSSSWSRCIEKEHMFDKVVTPSDVGKLNRLVIPKQHAEKFFPLDPSSQEKGLMLSLEDFNGNPWRFRYSFWSSSQSYVITKGWSRFVKDTNLTAGDVISFHRGLSDSATHLLFIDWKRRLTHSTPQLPTWYQSFNSNPSTPWPITFSNNGVSNNSIPVVQGKATAKRLRLFGVNLDCPISSDSDEHNQRTEFMAPTAATAMPLSHATLLPQRPLLLKLYNGVPLSSKAKFSSSSSSLDIGM